MFARYRLFPMIAAALLILLVAGCAPAAIGTTASAPQTTARTAAALQTDQQPMPRTVSVTGSGTASAAPDVAYVQLGVEVIDTNAEQDVTESTNRMTAVMDAIKGMDIPEKDIQTVQYNISVEQQRDNQGQPTGEIRYHVINQVRVTLHDLSKTGELLQNALAAGANSVNSVTFSIENPEVLQQQARDQAIADAKSKADQLASGLGAQLGPVREISESGGVRPVMEAAPALVRSAASSAVPVSGGELSVSVQIQVVFDLTG